MADRLAGKAAFITGGASGIGAACAEKFAAEGAAVVIADLARSADNSDQVVDRIRRSGGTAHTVQCDVTSRSEVDEAVNAAAALVGGLHCVVASAGVATHPDHSFETPLLDIEAAHWNFVLDANLAGTLHTAQACASHMIDRGIEGSITTLASFAAKRPTRGVYSVSKAAVWMLTRALAEELGPRGVRVNSIAPGIIETPMMSDTGIAEADTWRQTQSARITLGRTGTPGDVAGVAAFLASADSGYMTGSILHPDGGLASSFAGG